MTKTAIVPTNDAASLLAMEAMKIAAIDERTAKKTEFFAGIATLGELAARASTTVVDLALSFQAGIRDGFITAGEAKATYQAYADGMKRAIVADKLEGRGAETMSDASMNSQASILKTFAEPAAILLGGELYALVIQARKGLTSEEKTGSAYSNMALANRKAAEFHKGFASNEAFAAAVTLELVTEWIGKKGAPAKDAKDKLKLFVDAGLKLAKGDFATDGKFIRMMEELQAYQAAITAGKAPAADLIKGGDETKH